MSDGSPRSAYEIAMERLRQKDVRDGVDHQPRTDEQKAAIADIRSLYDAKIAQAEVMHRSAVVGILDEDAPDPGRRGVSTRPGPAAGRTRRPDREGPRRRRALRFSERS